MTETVHYASATGVVSSSWLLLLLPALGAVVLLSSGRALDRIAPVIGCATVGVSFVLGLVYFFALRGSDDTQLTLKLFDWIPVGTLNVEFGLLYDRLSSVFVLLITGVGFLIHLYAVGYMAHDPGRRRFFGYFNLFVFSMLLLVLANNYVGLYAGWEGVGVASYLLIGFYSDRPAASTAARKAFLMNRVGDVGLAIAIFLMFTSFGTISYAGVFSAVGGASGAMVAGIALLLLLGACGKSGQFPLQAWLPDAMEGPTPVSALIHAATMVTAGVYLIARSHPIFDISPTGQLAVCAVGAFTLLLGSIVGCAKDDMKRVLAYSTVSQIGYMFLAVGLGGQAYALGILHLLAHGFFKANLFLSSGSVMHAMGDEVDIRRFGGLRKAMPITFVTFGLGYLAIIGFPGLSGYFSKDPIIEQAFNRPGWTGYLFGLAALIGAGLTAFYMTRLFVLMFFGDKRWNPDRHPHEGGPIMTTPVAVLALGSALAGGLLVAGHSLVHWLDPVLSTEEVGPERFNSWLLTGASLLLMVLGAALAWVLFGRGPQPTEEPVARSPLVIAARRNLFADAVNEALFMRPGQWLTRALVYLDNRGVDGVVNSVAATLGGGSGRLRRLQTGFVRSYALTMLVGSLVVVVAMLAVRLG